MTLIQEVETKNVHGADLPWVPFAPYSDEVFLKYFRIDPVRGEILVSMRFPPGLELPKHYHTGIVIGHTIRGAWRYLEHDWVATEGSFVYEPPGEIHTLVVDEQVGATEMITFFNIHGAMVYVDDAGHTTGYEDVFSKIAAQLGDLRVSK